MVRWRFPRIIGFSLLREMRFTGIKSNPMGVWFPLGQRLPADSIAITPNEQLVIGGNIIYSLTSTGDLVNGTSGPGIDYPRIDPLGRGFWRIFLQYI